MAVDKYYNTISIICAVCYGTVQLVIAVAVSIHSVRALRRKDHFCKVWLQTTWKMRTVYNALAAHTFDTLTDILVIFNWLATPNQEGDSVNHPQMALIAIIILIQSRLVSAFAIFLKEKDIRRCLLQCFDLLIYEEIYESHKKHRKHIESMASTLSFKYIRSLEAVFESLPQSVLQIVFIIRTRLYDVDAINWVSLVWSIWSMANSIVNNDNTYMQHDRYRAYKKRLPPTAKFLRHAACRLSEVLYRIGVLSLFWVICGGEAFAVMLVLDLCLMIATVAYLASKGEMKFNRKNVLSAVVSMIVIPSQQVYLTQVEWHLFFGSDCCASAQTRRKSVVQLVPKQLTMSVAEPAPTKTDQNQDERDEVQLEVDGIDEDEQEDEQKPITPQSPGTAPAAFLKQDSKIGKRRKCCDCDPEETSYVLLTVATNLFCCGGLAALLTSISSILLCRDCQNVKVCYIPTVRIGISILEILFTLLAAIFWKEGQEHVPLLRNEAGLGIAVTTCICFLIYTQYRALFPEVKLPLDIDVRSKWGYAYSNELQELKKMQIPSDYKRSKEISGMTYKIEDEATFWDEPVHYEEKVPMTAAVYALAKGNQEVVEWLEQRGAKQHKIHEIDSLRAMQYMEKFFSQDGS